MNSNLLVTAGAFLAVFLLEGLFPYFTRRRRFRHLLPNGVLAVISFVLHAALFASATAAVTMWGRQNSVGLLHNVSLPVPAVFLVSFVLFDIWMYIWHRANHRIPFLWRFHQVHHTDRELDASTALRFHPGEMILSFFATAAVLGLLGMGMVHLVFYRLVSNPNIFFHHSNVALPERWDRRLRAFIVTPNMHRVHHSHYYHETDSNYSTVFSFWDRLARTFRKRTDTRTIIYGIEGMMEKKWMGVKAMLLTPLWNSRKKERAE
ncbi:MAG: sterol desaturase family protein [Candidatus Omnitrophica bacterium]|nr:sterol desaturase family protein [Candidatus Omnitrophota bacterium]